MCVLKVIGAPSRLRLIRKATALARVLLTLDFSCEEIFTRLAYTGLRGGLEHLKTETRLLDERFASVMGQCEIVNAARRKFESARQCRFKYCLL